MAKRPASQFPVLTKFQREAEAAAARLARLEEAQRTRSTDASRFAGRKLAATARGLGQQISDEEKAEEKEQRPNEISPSEVRDVFAQKQERNERAKQQVQKKAQTAIRDAARKEIRQVGKTIAKQFTRQAIAAGAKALLANPYVLAVLAVIAVVIIVLVLIFAVGLSAAGSDPAISGTSVEQPISPVDSSGSLKTVLSGTVRSAAAARSFSGELQKLRQRFDTNPSAITTIDALQQAAKTMIANPADQAILKEQGDIITAKMTDLLALLTLPERIAIVALSKVSDPTRNYYAPDPTRACAAFVGKILREVKAVPNVCSLRADTLADEVQRYGATRIIADDTPLNQGAVSQLVVGDVIFFNKRPGYYGHTGIAIGGGEMVDTSSGEERVKKRPVMDLRRNYQSITSYRFK